jgi:hypothetical protein
MTMNKVLILLITFITCVTAYSQEVEVEVSPPEPLLNEVFYLTFKIKTSSNTEPYISFTPNGAVVQGKSEQGVSISTTVINGKFTTSREQNYVYELFADRQGQVTIRNIKIEMGGKTTTLKDVYVNVLAQAKKVPDAFMEATVSKTKVYLGEGIDVNYYLYYKTSLIAQPIKQFPKLNKFIKRFHQINSPQEMVQYKGQVFKRQLCYSARIFPEKLGSAVVDPLSISVQIVENEYSSPFGGFGMGSQRYKNKDLSSPRIEIEVLPLPAENVPAGFTGLVGEHDFSLSVNKSKYFVNEPVEVKLEVKGKGALENLDAPSIYANPSLEQFDTKSEVTEIGSQSAKKIFDYTYLARGPLTLSARTLSLAYFDPSSGKYIEKQIQIPGIEVSGAAVASNKASNNAITAAQVNSGSDNELDFISKLFSSKNTSKKVEKNIIGLVGPVLSSQSDFSNRWGDLANLVLIGVIAIFSLFWFKTRNRVVTVGTNSKIAKKIISNLKSRGLNYSELYKLVTLLGKDNQASIQTISIYQLIDNSLLNQDTKEYFKKTLIACEEKSFGANKGESEIKFIQSHFNEIAKHI